jgi:multiple sugar transport system ATP-binding protein
MGRAIVRQPGLFLMDEPLSNLDAKLRTETRANIRALQRRLGTTTIFVTHDQVEAMTLGDRVTVLKDGSLQQVGAPRELYERPVNLFVAGFMGSPAMNIRKAAVSEHGLTIGETVINPPAETIAAIRKAGAREVMIGIRPESVAISPADGRMRMSVLAIEELGAERHVIGTLATDGPDEKPFIIRHIDGSPPAPGETIPLSPHDPAVHVFDVSTGLRLGAAAPEMDTAARRDGSSLAAAE